MSKRIKWTLNEERDLAARMFARWQQVPGDPEMKIYEWVMANDWPQERRRKVAGFTAIPETRKLYFKMLADLIAKGLTADNAPPEAPEPEGETISTTEICELLKQVVVEKTVAYDPTRFLRSQPLGTLVNEIYARQAEEMAAMMGLLQRIFDAVTDRRQPFPTIQRPVAAPAPAALPRRTTTRIAVLGLIPDQFRHVEEAVAGRAELVLVKNELTTDAKNFSANVDYAVINIKFVSHEQARAMTAAVGREHVEIVSGGVTTVTQAVFDILSRQRA